MKAAPLHLHFESALLHKKEIKRLFLSAFPRNERPPIRLLYRRHRQGRADFRAVLDGERFIGLVLITGCETVKTLMFFAIEEAFRGKGYGSAVLGMVKKEVGSLPFFLCAEPLDDAAENAQERVNRLQFYAHNGLTETGLHVTEAGVEYTVLTPGTPLSYAQYKQAMLPFFGRLRFSRICRK